MRILGLADAASIHTQKWARYLAGRGHEISLVSFSPARLDSAQVHHIDTGAVRPEGGNWHYMLGLPAVRRHILKTAPDVIFCHYLSSYGLIGALLKSDNHLVIWLHGTDILVKPRKSLLYRMTARYALARADLIIMAAEHIKQRLQHLGGIGKRSIVVPLGVNLQEFNQTGILERKGLTCISSRLLKKNSNVDVILKAIAIARRVIPDVHLTVIGDGPLKPLLEIEVQRLDLASCVAFLGHVPNDEMPNLLRSHTLYLSATSSDGTSVSLLEAMACGTFPIASDIPANQAWIRSGENGFLVPTGRPDLFARSILEAFEASRLTARAQALNWDIVKERGGFHSNMERAEQALVQLLDGSTPAVAS